MSFKALILAMLVLTCSGCIKVSTGQQAPTLGEQFVELTRAKELGALTEEEYQILRKKVLANF